MFSKRMYKACFGSQMFQTFNYKHVKAYNNRICFENCSDQLSGCYTVYYWQQQMKYWQS